MKFFEIEAVRDHLRNFSRIRRIRRIEDNTLCLAFDGGESIAFDLSRGGGDIFAASCDEGARAYHAPFDNLLKKRFEGARILGVETPGGDKVLAIEAEQRGAYKSFRSTLRLEFTGRHTNAIILDERGVVLEALRHVDEESSYRVVKPGLPLAPLPPYEGPRTTGSVDDTASWLQERARARKARRLAALKKRHANALAKRIERLKKALAELPEARKLEEEAKRYADYGAIVLAHLHEIAPYDRKLETVDFAGNPVTIELPPLPNPKRMGEHFFTLSRRAANKAKNLHIEKENLRSRLAFYERLRRNLEKAESESQIHLLFPPRQHNRRKREPRLQCETFQIGEWRLLVGRNERENAWLLGHARAGDLWMHLKDRPSAHCILQSGGRRQVPRAVVEKAARICVEASTTQPGDYLVDFTPRRNVKIVKGAQVNYVDYDTVKVRKGS
ncbi:NFACT family protein [Hydrogenimonas sp.]